MEATPRTGGLHLACELFGTTPEASPAGRRRRHEVTEEQSLVHRVPTTTEPVTHVVGVAFEELGSVRVADDVDDLRPVDEDEPRLLTLALEEHVVGREVTVRPAELGEPEHRLAQLLEEHRQQVGVGPHLREAWCSQSVRGADELHQHLVVGHLHRIGHGQALVPEAHERLELREGPEPADQLLAERGAGAHGPHLPRLPHPPPLEIARVPVEHAVLARPVALAGHEHVPVGRARNPPPHHVDVGLLARLEHPEVGVDRAEVGDDPVGPGLRAVGRPVPARPPLTLGRPVGVGVDRVLLVLEAEDGPAGQPGAEDLEVVIVKCIERQENSKEEEETWAGMPGAVTERDALATGGATDLSVPSRPFGAIRVTGPPCGSTVTRRCTSRVRLGGSPSMPSASFGGGAVRVRAPRGYDASTASDRADRDLPGGGAGAAQRAALVEALRSADFMVIERIDLTPQRGRDLDGRAPDNRRGTVTLDVDVPAGHDAVVLLERDGLYSWHLPLGAAERTRSIEHGPRT